MKKTIGNNTLKNSSTKIADAQSSKQAIKVFHNDKLLILKDKDDFIYPEFFAYCIKTKEELHRFVRRWLAMKNCDNIIIYGTRLENLINDFKAFFKNVEAAGGMVKNPDGEILFIRRWDRWDLPKGKKEKGETPEETALREVKEETGLRQLIIEKKLAESYHIYYDKPPYYLKHSHWFAMSTTQIENLKPQTEEDITDVVWMDKGQCKKAFSETYRTLREILEDQVC